MTPSRRALRPLALAVLAGLTLTGCGAGLNAQTNQRRTFSEGANVIAPGGQILVRNFYLAPPGQEEAQHDPGDDVRAYAVFVNQGDTDDRLVSASSPVARNVTFWTGGDPAVGVNEYTEEFVELFEPSREARPGGTDTRAVAGDVADDLDAEADPDATASPSPSAGGRPSAGADGQEVEAFDIPLGDKLEVLPGAGYLLLEDVQEVIYPGTTVEVTLEFAEAGTITFPAYVHVLAEPAERETPGSAEEGNNPPAADSFTDLESGS